MALYEDLPDPTAPYTKAVDLTSRYIMPGLDALDKYNPSSMAARAISEKLRGPFQAGAKILNQGANQLPRMIPGVGAMQDITSLAMPEEPGPMGPPAPPTAQAPRPAVAPPAAVAQPPAAALPPAAPAPPPPPMPTAQAPGPSAAAGGSTAPTAPTAPMTPGAPGAPGAVGVDPQLQASQDALDEYYSGVIGTGPAQRKAQRAMAMMEGLRGTDRGRMDAASQMARALDGLTTGLSYQKANKLDDEREKKLDDLREAYMRNRRGKRDDAVGNVTEADFK